ncbi:MAG: VCBS repeat-containing protein, partial [Ginsengibacter sp.]
MLFPNQFKYLFFLTLIFLYACHSPVKIVPSARPLFTLLPANQTHIDFNNQLTEGLNTNVLMYEYFYNGGGVAIGDVNGDGLQDIYFSGNMVDNKLYLNKGHMQFEDITNIANVEGRPGPWKTGVTMVDINGDGKMDIFVCYSGKLRGAKRVPQLFINLGNDKNGVPHFEDEAKQFGLTDSSYSTQAYFFDYDHDGDLDLLLLNHNPKRISDLNQATIDSLIIQKDDQSGIRLYRNDNNHFVDVTKQSGLLNSTLNYNLSAGIADLNNDGWPDIYLSNDYLVPDYLYINNHDGTFTNEIQQQLGHTSEFSMGNNISDINNDGLPDIFTLDMLPEDNHRQKLLTAPNNYPLFDVILKSGFYYQYMRNMLQLNNGNRTFSEIGQLSGISNTDWSWAPLFADYDNDGWKDLFITNGYLRDYTNMDFLSYMNDQLGNKNEEVFRQQLLAISQHIPTSNIKNYFFKN